MGTVSVLIKNTTMPKNCIECPMQFGGWCYVCPPDIDERVAETVEEAVKQGKPDWCPLVEIEGDDVAPVVHGRWILSTDMTYMPQCSNCGRHPFKGYIPSIEEVKRVYKHCPVCGAKMDEREDSDNE